MKNVSLLPPEIKARRLAQRRRALYFMGAGGVLLLFLVIYTSLLTMTLLVRSDTRVLRERQSELENITAGYKQYEALEASVAKNNKLLRQAMGDIPEWPNLITELNRCRPLNVWLTGLNAAYHSGTVERAAKSSGTQTAAKNAAEKNEIVIQGFANDYPAVANWFEDIQDITGLTDVQCRFIGEQALDSNSWVKFEIKAGILPGSPFSAERSG
ncbi:MAG: hypothetical protein PHD36_04295 [Desulfotomaculaceae bacterium]|nr:hypothetical protein [Desulfotomaculaceae bacterium]